MKNDETIKQFREMFGTIGQKLGETAKKIGESASEIPKIMDQKKLIDTCVSAHLKSCVDVDYMMKIIDTEMKAKNMDVNNTVLMQLVSNRLGLSIDDISTHQRMYGIHRRG